MRSSALARIVAWGSLKRPAGSAAGGEEGLVESVPSRLSCDASCYMVREHDEGFGGRHEYGVQRVPAAEHAQKKMYF